MSKIPRGVLLANFISVVNFQFNLMPPRQIGKKNFAQTTERKPETF